MSNEDIIEEIEKASKFVSEAARDVKAALCHSRNVVENENNEKAYNKGLEDAWELAKKLYNMTCSEIEKIFDVQGGFYEVIRDFTPQEALVKIEAYEKKKEIKVGDVVESKGSGTKGVVLNIKDYRCYILFKDGSAGIHRLIDFKKTNKHIDITSVLEQLKGE